MKILLVYPTPPGMYTLPPAIGLFTAILRKKGHDVSLFDASMYSSSSPNFDSEKAKKSELIAREYDDSIFRDSLIAGDVHDQFVDKVQTFAPDMIAISCVEDTFELACKLLEKLGDSSPFVVIGGVFPTFAPQLCIDIPQIDAVCIGEGEEALPELCLALEGLRDFNISNIWIKRNGAIIKNKLIPPLDVDNIVLPDYSLFHESRFYRPMQGKVWRMLPIETHRGCPQSCTYCNSPSMRNLYKRDTGKLFFRKKSINKIEEELNFCKDVLNADSFFFWADDLLATSERELDKFFEMYSKFSMPFFCQARPEHISESRIKKLMDVGLFRMGVGVEHGNEEFRTKYLDRRVTNKEMLKAFEILNNVKLSFSVNNITGFPFETRELAFDTIEINRQIQADNHLIFTFSPFHGTKLREVAIENDFLDPGSIAHSFHGGSDLKMPGYTADEIDGIKRCFVLYVNLPKSYWSDIQQAECATPEGDEILKELQILCKNKYLNWKA